VKEIGHAFEMCTPRLRWIPEHCMHTKIPKFTLAHLGPLQNNNVAISDPDKTEGDEIQKT